MNKLKVSLILILLLFIFTGTVYANDFNSNDTVKIDSSDKEIISQVDQNNNTFADLQKLIDVNEEIDLEMDYIFNKTTDSSLIVNHTITINGNGHILNASNSNRILTINASNVILKNIIFTDGYLKTGNGAAIIWYGNGGTLENCTFTNNEAYYGNAALYLGADYVDVVNCTFKDNIASTAGALFWNGANGVLNNSIFVNNFADGNGLLFRGMVRIIQRIMEL